MPTVDANGISLYYEVRGSGAPIVVVNGLGMDVWESRVVAAPLAETFRVLAFDNRGAGRTDKPRGPYSVEMMAADTAAVIEAVGFGRPSVMGISLGGRIALELALQRPDLVNKLLLVSTGARVQHTLARGLFTNPFLRVLAPGRYPQPRYAYLRQREASSNYDATARLSAVQAPTLIMHGEHDLIAPMAIARELEQGIPDARLVTFRGGHLFFLFRDRRRFVQTATSFALA